MNIILHIKGGLGNQMFQYAMGRTLQMKYPGAKLLLDISEISKDTKRKFGLDAFKLTRDVIVTNDMRYLKCYKNQSVCRRRLWDYCPKLIFIYYLLKENILWWDELYYVKIPRIKDNVYVNGYWQSERFFEKCIQEILEDFEFKYSISEKNRQLAEKLLLKESVCVHIRLGDYCYKGNEDYLVCTPEYYKKCIYELLEEIPDVHFFVFSDEPERAKVMLHEIDEKITYVEKGNEDYEELQLMSLCKHFIISNSTFSWWAQYLSKYKNKIVYAPENWMNSGKNKEIYLAGWRKK